jgi:hypothetical protein
LRQEISGAVFQQAKGIFVPHVIKNGSVIYTSKDGKNRLVFFDVVDGLAQLTTHIPNKNEQMARYYG